MVELYKGHQKYFLAVDCVIFGYEKEELLQMTFLDLTPPKWHKWEQKRISQAFKTKNHVELYQKEYIRKDKSVFPIEIAVSKSCIAGKTIVWGIIRDISDRRKALKKLKASEKSFRELYENDPIGRIRNDMEGKILQINFMLAKMAGYMNVKDFIETVKKIDSGKFLIDYDREKALSAGCVAHIAKPVDRSLLFSVLQKYL